MRKVSEQDKKWFATVGGGNAVEVATVNDGRVLFDHSTGAMRAEWANGRTEHWFMNGYSAETKEKAFRDCVERWSEA